MESTQASSTPQKEKKGLGRLWKKVKAAFKDKVITPATSSTTAKPKEASKPAEPVKASEPSAPTGTAAATTAIGAQPTSQPSQQDDMERRKERIKAMFKEYNVDIDESELKFLDFKPTQPAERVHKSPRMRVHYTCHNCNTSFGHAKVCLSCQHPRCKQCVRYPPKKVKTKTTDAAAAATSQEPKQNTKCSCHECQTGFDTGAEECPNCHHKICEKCIKQAVIEFTPAAAPATTEPQKKPAPSETVKAGEAPAAAAAS